MTKKSLVLLSFALLLAPASAVAARPQPAHPCHTIQVKVPATVCAARYTPSRPTATRTTTPPPTSLVSVT